MSRADNIIEAASASASLKVSDKTDPNTGGWFYNFPKGSDTTTIRAWLSMVAETQPVAAQFLKEATPSKSFAKGVTFTFYGKRLNISARYGIFRMGNYEKTLDQASYYAKTPALFLHYIAKEVSAKAKNK